MDETYNLQVRDMKCLICGNQSSRMNYCWTCRKTLDKDTGLNFEEINELENLLQRCHSLRQLMISKDYLNLSSLTKMRKIFSLFFSEEAEENPDLNTLIDLEGKLQYVLEQLKLGTIEISHLSNEMITENYLEKLKNWDNVNFCDPRELQILKVYKSFIDLNIQNIDQNLILFSQFMVPIIQSKYSLVDKEVCPIDRVIHISNQELFHNNYFYIPGHSFLEYTDSPLTTYEAVKLLLEHYQNDWSKLTESDFDSKQIEKIGVSYQLKRLANNYMNGQTK